MHVFVAETIKIFGFKDRRKERSIEALARADLIFKTILEKSSPAINRGGNVKHKSNSQSGFDTCLPFMFGQTVGISGPKGSFTTYYRLYATHRQVLLTLILGAV